MVYCDNINNTLTSWDWALNFIIDSGNIFGKHIETFSISCECYLRLTELQHFQIEWSDKHLAEPHQQLKDQENTSTVKTIIVAVVLL